jgi:hypothetical protein
MVEFMQQGTIITPEMYFETVKETAEGQPLRRKDVEC